MLAGDCVLADSGQKMDIISEILDGRSIADFIDPDISEKLEALEREEEAEGFYNGDEELAHLSSSPAIPNLIHPTLPAQL